MSIRSAIGWGLSLLITGLLLVKMPLPDGALTLNELMRNHASEIENFNGVVSKACNSILPESDTEIEKEFIRTSKFNFAVAANKCLLKISESSQQRYFLKKNTALNIRLTRQSSQTILEEKTFLLEHLLPLALLPFFAFFWALLFDIKFFGPPAVFLSFFFFYSGLSPLSFLDESFFHFFRLLEHDKNVIGLCLLFIWTRLCKVERSTPWVSKCILTLSGIWNPAFIVATRKSLFWLGKSSKAKSHLLSLQAVFLMLSFSLLAASSNEEDIFLPRYFTFAFLIILIFQSYSGTKNLPNYLWKNPFRITHLVTVLIGELGFHFLHLQVPFILRIALELNAAECVHLKEWRFTWRESKFIASRLSIFLFSAYAAFYASHLGILNLLFQILQINSLELGLPFALFLFGIFSGIVFGGIALPYYFVLSSFTQLSGLSVAKAGLMDGLILGTLLSPISLFNWFTAKDIHMGIHRVIKERIKGLRLSIFAGGIVYFVSGMNSVKILQPVTFLFLMLVLFVNYMREKGWKWLNDKNLQAVRSAPHST